MKENVVAYGLGKIFHKFNDEIKRDYSVNSYCDKDINKIQNIPGGVSPELLKFSWNQYDKILITTYPMKVISYLIDELLIPKNMVSIFLYDRLQQGRMLFNFFGQHYEDAVLLTVMAMLHYNLSDVRYLEIGVNDPILHNNSYALYKAGASGVLVDPLHASNILADLVRPRDQYIEAAVTASSSRTIHLYTCHNSPVSSTSKKWVESFHNDDEISELIVSAIEINALLEELRFIPDILLLDVEGMDYQILEAINYEKYKPTVIMAELGSGMPNSFADAMEMNGYFLFSLIYDNAIFVLKEKWTSVFNV